MIILNTLYVFFCITIGIQTTAYTLVGREIGAKNVAGAKRYRDLIILIGITLALAEGLTLYLFRGMIARVFTNIEELIVILDETY